MICRSYAISALLNLAGDGCSYHAMLVISDLLGTNGGQDHHQKPVRQCSKSFGLIVGERVTLFSPPGTA